MLQHITMGYNICYNTLQWVIICRTIIFHSNRNSFVKYLLCIKLIYKKLPVHQVIYIKLLIIFIKLFIKIYKYSFGVNHFLTLT